MNKDGRNRIGVMQGRLLPPINGRIQAFPLAAWREEFVRASECEFSSIEWIWESPITENPLWMSEGREEIRSVCAHTGVEVSFICADYFMETPFVRMSSVAL